MSDISEEGSDTGGSGILTRDHLREQIELLREHGIPATSLFSVITQVYDGERFKVAIKDISSIAEALNKTYKGHHYGDDESVILSERSDLLGEKQTSEDETDDEDIQDSPQKPPLPKSSRSTSTIEAGTTPRGSGAAKTHPSRTTQSGPSTPAGSSRAGKRTSTLGQKRTTASKGIARGFTPPGHTSSHSYRSQMV